MKTRLNNTSWVLIVTWVLMTLFIPSLGHTAVTITAEYYPAIGNGLDPANNVWNSATPYTVPLDTIISAAGVPQLLPPSNFRYLMVKVIHDGTDIFFRYQWPDSTADISVADSPLFADGVAMEIPFVAGLSSIAMGNQSRCWDINGQPTPTTCGAVNIIYWRADMEDPLTPGLGQPQNIVAGGIGTVQEGPEDLPISHSQVWANGSWTVIIKRPLSGAASPRGNMVTLAQGGNYQITFAQWEGGNLERDGVKLVAGSWQTLLIQ